MSRTKFNGFEKWFLTTAINHAVEEAEAEIKEKEGTDKRGIFAAGYFEMVGKELIEKVNGMTLKKDQ